MSPRHAYGARTRHDGALVMRAEVLHVVAGASHARVAPQHALLRYAVCGSGAARRVPRARRAQYMFYAC